SSLVVPLVQPKWWDTPPCIRLPDTRKSEAQEPHARNNGCNGVKLGEALCPSKIKTLAIEKFEVSCYNIGTKPLHYNNIFRYSFEHVSKSGTCVELHTINLENDGKCQHIKCMMIISTK
ncbi:3714_t:CDS:2, partial [Acaulospora morrowiae]